MTISKLISDKDFKDAMSNFCTGVTIITSMHNNIMHGITANSFASVSLNPKLVSVCLKNGLFLLDLINGSSAFAIHILSSDNIFLAERFAGFHKDNINRFENVDHVIGKTNAPIIKGISIFIECELYKIYDAGDHKIVLGEVVNGNFDSIENHDAKHFDPLLYYNRKWRKML